MYTPIQIEIIKKFWRNDLTFGCIIIHRVDDDFDWESHIAKITESDSEWICFTPKTPYWCTNNSQDTTDYEILWHEPHLEDVFRVAEEKWFYREVRTITYSRIELSTKENPYPLCIPYNITIPLLSQGEDTLKQLLKLL